MQQALSLLRQAILLGVRAMMLVMAALLPGSVDATAPPDEDTGTERGLATGTFIPVAGMGEGTPATLAQRFTATPLAGQSLDELVNTLTPDREPVLLTLLSMAMIDDEVAGRHIRWVCQPYSGDVAMKNYLGWAMLVYQESFVGCYNDRAAPNWRLEKHIGESKSGGVDRPSYQHYTYGTFFFCAERSSYSENVYPSVELTARAKGQIKVR